MTLTPTQLQQIGKTINFATATKWANAFNNVLPMYGMDNPDVFHEFIANIMEESAELSRMDESLNYSVQGLIDTFGKHRITEQQAAAYGRTAGQKANQQAIANTVYGGTFGKTQLGNDQPGDGYAFRGAGPMQLTGRSNITLFTLFINKKLGTSYSIAQVADLLRTDAVIGAHSACWVFAIAKGLVQAAIDDKMKLTVKKINGGFTGLDKRMTYYDRAKKAIPE